MAIHKLADGPITMTVATVDVTEGNFGAQLRFTGSDGTTVYVNELSAQKQLSRNAMTMESVVGETIHMEQVKKDGKTYTNISRASGAQVASAAAGTPAAPARAAAPAKVMSMEEMTALYAQCVDVAFSVFGARCENVGVPVTAESLQAAAATLFIKATR